MLEVLQITAKTMNIVYSAIKIAPIVIPFIVLIGIVFGYNSTIIMYLAYISILISQFLQLLVLLEIAHGGECDCAKKRDVETQVKDYESMSTDEVSRVMSNIIDELKNRK